MPLQETGYQAAAKTELERRIRELEDRDKAAQTRNDFFKNASEVQSNIEFAQKLNLVGEEQAQRMKKRIEAAVRQHRFMRNESGESTDDFENPRERAKRFFNMDDVHEKISQERAAAAESKQGTEDSQNRRENLQPKEQPERRT